MFPLLLKQSFVAVLTNVSWVKTAQLTNPIKFLVRPN